MKKLRVFVAAVALLLVGLVAVPAAVGAATNMRSGNLVSVGREEVVDSTVYLAGTTVTVMGTIKGDLYCAGQNIDVTGMVEGDVICAGQTVNVSGNVLGDVRVAGQTVTIAGAVGHSLSAFGQSVTLSGDAAVNMDATVYGTSVQMGGKVGRDAVVGGQNVTLAGIVGRNVTSTVDWLALGGGAQIGGDVNYTSSHEVDKGTSAVVGGKTVRHDPPIDQDGANSSWAAQLWGVTYWFGAWLVLGLLLLAVMPRSYQATSNLMVRRGGWVLLAGTAALIMTPIVAVMLMVTVLGIPAGVILLLLWIVAMMAACAYSGFALGQWVVAQTGWNLKWPTVTSLALGLFLLALLMLIPVVGGLFSFLALVWGLGGITLAVSESLRSHHDDKGSAKSTKKAKA